MRRRPARVLDPACSASPPRRLRWPRHARPFALTLAALLWSAAGSSRAEGFGDYHPAPVYAAMSVRSFYIPMRDGVRLAVRLYRPAVGGAPAAGRFPVIWHGSLDIADTGPGAAPLPTGVRFGTEPTGDDPRWENARDLSSLTRHGYVVAVVARRGSGASFGRRRGYEDMTEADDAYEITEWLARQPWSSGAVGVYGCSNTGEAAMHVLTVRPPHLKAVFAGCFSWNRYDGFTRGGIIANWGAGPQRTLAQDLQATPVDGDAGRSLLRQAAESHQGSTYLFDLMKGMPYRDSWSPLTMSRFWAEASISSYQDQIRQSGAALYIQAGWRDDFRLQGLITFANFPPGRRYMVIGDWTHCSNTGFDLRSEQLRFFDHYLKGLDTGITRDAPLHYTVVNAASGSAWRGADDWPPPASSPKRLFLAADDRLEDERGRAAVSSIPVRTDVVCPNAPHDPLAVALAQPCHPSAGAASWSTPPLTHDATLVGDPTADLWIAANATDARVFAYLEDVAPDGRVAVLSDARLDLALRRTRQPPWNDLGLPWHPSRAEDAEPLVPERAVQVRLAFLPVAYRLKAGHRLQVSVAGADPRERDRPAHSADTVLQVVSGGAEASSLSIPMLGATP